MTNEQKQQFEKFTKYVKWSCNVNNAWTASYVTANIHCTVSGVPNQPRRKVQADVLETLYARVLDLCDEKHLKLFE